MPESTHRHTGLDWTGLDSASDNHRLHLRQLSLLIKRLNNLPTLLRRFNKGK